MFREEYLRKPIQTDVDRLLAVAEARDFPGMLGSIHCMPLEMEELSNELQRYLCKRYIQSLHNHS